METLKNQTGRICEYFKKENIEFALAGAFALHAYGYTRATKDVDFVINGIYQEKVTIYLESIGFETLHQSKGYSNHIHPMEAVRLDFIYVDQNTANQIFGRIGTTFKLGEHSVPVVHPEHLVAMKLSAAKNEPQRKFRELADVGQLIKITGMQKKQVAKYFVQFGLEGYLDEL